MKLQLFILISSVVLFQYTFGAIKPRIIGGKNARAGQFPYAAAVTTRTATSQLFCGGTLCASQYILTSAQCVVDAISFTIQLGSTHLNQSDNNRIILSTSEYITHPDFNRSSFANDIGLIKLRQKVDLNFYVNGVNKLQSVELEDYAPVTAFGWGQTSDNVAGQSEQLQFVELTTLSNAECKAIYGNQISENMVCVSGQLNEGTCFGDIGTPLVQNYTHPHTMVVAIATFLSGNGCESTNPSGYTSLYPYVSWIRNITGFK